MDLFDIAVAKKLSGSGGGSSDFSTAEVTIIPVIEGSPTLTSYGLATANEEELPSYFFECYSSSKIKLPIPSAYSDSGLMLTSTMAYDENNRLYSTHNFADAIITGNAELGGEYIFIKGDCTIEVEMIPD